MDIINIYKIKTGGGTVFYVASVGMGSAMERVKRVLADSPDFDYESEIVFCEMVLTDILVDFNE